MDPIEKRDITRLRELLRRTSEFIAYFEYAETKMIEWREQIDQQATHQQQQFQEQLQTLQQEFALFQDVVTKSGLSRFQTTAEKALQQAESYLTTMQKTEQQTMKHLSETQQHITALCEQSVQEIQQEASNAVRDIHDQLVQYDPKHFRRITSDACEQVERSALQAILKSGKLLRLFHWRTVALAFLTSVLTAFSIGLYISDEFPWEIHQHAMNERGAGKMLMNAWPKLTYQEKVKILGETAYKKNES